MGGAFNKGKILGQVLAKGFCMSITGNVLEDIALKSAVALQKSYDRVIAYLLDGQVPITCLSIANSPM